MKKITLILTLFILITSCVSSDKEISKGDFPDTKEIIAIETESISNTKDVILSRSEQVKLIEKYYQLIGNQKLEQAYDLKYEPSISLESFINEYTFKNKSHIEIYDFTDIEQNKYNFRVTIVDLEAWFFSYYLVSMEIINGTQVKTLSVQNMDTEKREIQEIDWQKEINMNGEKIIYGIESEIVNNLVYISPGVYGQGEGTHLSRELYIIQNNSDKIIVNDHPCAGIENIEFIGNLMIYDWLCTHGTIKRAFNISTQKEIAIINEGDFTEDRKYIYSCYDYDNPSLGMYYAQLLDINTGVFKNYGVELNIGGQNNDYNKTIMNCKYSDNSMSFDIGIKKDYNKFTPINSYKVDFNNGILIESK